MDSRKAILGGMVALALSLVLAAPAGAGSTNNIAPGSDLFETSPDATQFIFAGPTTLPAGFFGPGSDPFAGAVRFYGVPLGKVSGKSSGDADTVVKRMGPAILPQLGGSDTIPIELTRLSLRSVEPITVTFGGGSPQQWNVQATVSPTVPSQGTMTLRRTSAEGGTFSSQLSVLPKLSFTPVSGGTPRVLDAGQIFPGGLAPLTFHSQGSPFVDSDCQPPALDVPGVNDSFCAGQTPQDEKKPTVEDAQLARHGVEPVQPLLDHFKCYSVARVLPRPFRQRQVGLTDQFKGSRAKVRRSSRLCNPAQKNKEPIQNRQSHLKCYGIRDSGTFTKREVMLVNQFGTVPATVNRPETLCLPSRKRIGPFRPRKSKAPPVDHFKCYSISSNFQPRTVTLKDQFHTKRATLLRARRLCNPVQKVFKKKTTKIGHALHHLACYDIRRTRFRPRLVTVTNQFETVRLRATRPRELCVPSLKLKRSPPKIPPGIPVYCDPSTVSDTTLVLSFGLTNCSAISVGGATGQVAFGCNSLPANTQCDFLPPNAHLPPNGMANTQLFFQANPGAPLGMSAFNVVATRGSLQSSSPMTANIPN